jgi:metal-sulfur cluster biosynthetic enzyme
MSAFGRAPFIAIWETTRACAGLAPSLTPSGTAAATADRLRALRDAGLMRLAVSLDGASAERHDAFRGVRGSHRHTLAIVERARALGLPFQINTTVSSRTVADLPELARQVETFGVALWALFFLIPVGRGRADEALGAQEIERVLGWAADLAARAPFGVKTTEAPHYGFLFVDHVGNICPSGFLPLVAGNVRRDDPVAVYREHPLFTLLRDPARLGGRCGRCEHRERCGGSRARAWAVAGDPLAEDPGCAYEPAPAPVAARPLPIAGGSDAPPAVTEAQVVEALRTVVDPELGLSVVALGLVYGITIDGGAVAITMTLTTPGCPIHDVMPAWVREAVGRIPGVERVDVTLTFDPPWTPDRMAPPAPVR